MQTSHTTYSSHVARERQPQLYPTFCFCGTLGLNLQLTVESVAMLMPSIFFAAFSRLLPLNLIVSSM